MPCDERRHGYNLDVYFDILDKISCCIQKYNPTYYFVGGDFNTAFNRISPQTDALRNFMDTEDLSSSSNITEFYYTYCSKDGNNSSTIDHILYSDNASDYILSYHIPSLYLL